MKIFQNSALVGECKSLKRIQEFAAKSSFSKDPPKKPSKIAQPTNVTAPTAVTKQTSSHNITEDQVNANKQVIDPTNDKLQQTSVVVHAPPQISSSFNKVSYTVQVDSYTASAINHAI